LSGTLSSTRNFFRVHIVQDFLKTGFELGFISTNYLTNLNHEDIRRLPENLLSFGWVYLNQEERELVYFLVSCGITLADLEAVYSYSHGKSNPGAFSAALGDLKDGRLTMKQVRQTLKLIQTYARAIKDGDLDTLQREFAKIELQQRGDLLNLMLDFDAIFPHDLDFSCGFPVAMARKYQHENVAKFLEIEKEKISEYTKRATQGLFGEFLPDDSSEHIAGFLTNYDGWQVAHTITTALKKAELLSPSTTSSSSSPSSQRLL